MKEWGRIICPRGRLFFLGGGGSLCTRICNPLLIPAGLLLLLPSPEGL